MAELGETDDPKQLVPGNAANITATAQALRTRASELEQAGVGLSRIDSAEGWSGPAGDAFRGKFHGQPRSWLTAGDSFLDAATALDTYASTLAWAQGQAEQAINAWNAAQTATENAQTQYQTYQQQGGTQPFQDPGESGRAAAKKTLDNTRTNLENAGNTAATTVGTARDRAPEKPGFWSKSAASPRRSARAWKTPAARSSTRWHRSETRCCTTPEMSPRWPAARFWPRPVWPVSGPAACWTPPSSSRRPASRSAVSPYSGSAQERRWRWWAPAT
jgi:hypothetical protein